MHSWYESILIVILAVVLVLSITCLVNCDKKEKYVYNPMTAAYMPYN